MMELFIRYRNQLVSKLSRIDFYYVNLFCRIGVATFTFFAAIWLIHENLRKIFESSQQKINVWVKVVENIEIVVFVGTTLVSTIETILEKRSKQLNVVCSIEEQFKKLGLEETFKTPSLVLVFYGCFVILLLLQFFFESDNLNCTLFAIMTIGQLHLLQCVLQFVSVILNVTHNFQFLNKRLNTVLRLVELKCFSFVESNKLRVHDFSNIHWSLCKYVKMINEIYGLRLLAIVVCIFNELMFIPYLLSLNLMKVYSETSKKELMYTILLTFHLTQLLLLTSLADSAMKEASRTGLILSEYLSNDLEEDEFNHVAIMLTYFEFHRLEFKIKNLCVLNRNFVLKMFAAVTTYTIIFIQLQDIIKFKTE